MKIVTSLPQDQVFWYINRADIKPLTKDIITDVVVIGGGMAGLTAAHSFHKRGLKVVLLEKNYCGSGATGKSSGFITPDSELSLSDLVRIYGEAEGKKLWQFVESGVNTIRSTIEDYTIACDYQKQDTLVVASTKGAFNSSITKEHATRQQVGYESSLYTESELPTILGSCSYKGGISYGGTFGIHGYRYCSGLKTVLQELGVQIYEETPALAIQDHFVKTPLATVKAEHIIVCIDRFAHALENLYDKLYHVQTFLMLSAPLTQAQVKTIFPRDPYLIWDTDLIYHYFRLTGDNRIMVGGSDLFYSYASKETHNNTRMVQKLTNYFTKKFPQSDVQFEYIWPGLIGLSKDIFPLCGPDKTMPSVYYAVAAAGLPWAAALGTYSSEAILDKRNDLDIYLSPYRSFKLGRLTQRILGTKLTFALSNFLSVNTL